MAEITVNNKRFTTQRGRYLARTTELREPEANAVAFAEAGYSISGISKNIDVSQSTVQSYLERAMALYGLEICETLLPDESPPDYDKIGPEYFDQLDEDDKSTWLTYFHRHADKLPQKWVNMMNDSSNEIHNFQP